MKDKFLIFIPNDENYIEILGHRIDGFESFKAFCEHLKKYAELEETVKTQKAELERLKAELKEDSRVMKQALVLVDEIKKEIAIDIETAKAEAVKEFAERVKSRLITVTYINFDDIIDNLVKEMVGEG